jgi:replication factor C subunit 2/4
LEAILFTAEGDMRNALNNLQSTYAGFDMVTADNVFKVCDQPHPKLVKHIIGQCIKGDMISAISAMEG